MATSDTATDSSVVVSEVAAALAAGALAAPAVPLPSVERVAAFSAAVRQLLLQPAGGITPHAVQHVLDAARELIGSSDTALAFVRQLPELQRRAQLDVQAAWLGDPAATSHAEVVACYPGLLAISAWRIAHTLHELGVPILPRMIAEDAHARTGIDIHPGATIGEQFFIDHGTGVVIGETCIIGNRVRIYQGVTLGARSFPLDAAGNPVKGVPRHPIVEDDVIIYAAATILGRITIGRGSTIGGNVWVTRDIPPGSRLMSKTPAATPWFHGGDGI